MNCQVYAPDADQPRLDRTLDELQPAERCIMDNFLNPDLVEKLITFMSLEEHKAKVVKNCYVTPNSPLYVPILNSLNPYMYRLNISWGEMFSQRKNYLYAGQPNSRMNKLKLIIKLSNL